MKLSEYSGYDALGLAELVKQKAISPKELCRVAITAIEKLNPTLNAVVQTLNEHVETLDESKLGNGVFRGVPYLLKDFYDVEKNVLSEGGCQLTQGYRGTHDSGIVKKFKRAGFINVGRTTVPEMGLSSGCDTRLCGTTHNPWNLEKIAGGSSGGAGVAVASGMVPLAHGNDAGGSIREPANFNGVVGFKPTRMRVSEAPDYSDGVCGTACNFALTKTIRDAAALLDEIHGIELGDAHSPPPPTRPFREEVGVHPGKLRIGFTTHAFDGAAVPAVIVEAVRKTAVSLQKMGFDIEEASPSFSWEKFSTANFKIWAANTTWGVNGFAQELNRKPSLDNLMKTTWKLYQYGKMITGVDILNALEDWATIRRQIAPYFQTYDVLLTPSSTSLAPVHALCNQDQEMDVIDWVNRGWQFSTFLAPFNVTGQPAVSLPLHMTHTGEQIGMHFVARYGDEATLIRLAALLEQEMPWKDRKPPYHVSND